MSSKRKIEPPTNRCSFGKECYRMNPDHFARFAHPHLDDIGSAAAVDISDSKLRLWKNQRKIMDQLFGLCSPTDDSPSKAKKTTKPVAKKSKPVARKGKPTPKRKARK